MRGGGDKSGRKWMVGEGGVRRHSDAQLPSQLSWTGAGAAESQRGYVFSIKYIDLTVAACNRILYC